MHDTHRVPAHDQHEADAGTPLVKGTDWEALAKQFYIRHGAQRSKR